MKEYINTDRTATGRSTTTMTTKLATAGFLIFATLLISAMATPQFEKQLSEDIAATEQSAAELVADLREDDDADSMSRLAEEDEADETAEESLQKRHWWDGAPIRNLQIQLRG